MNMRPLVFALTLSTLALAACKEDAPTAEASVASTPVATAPAQATPAPTPVAAEPAPKPVRKPAPKPRPVVVEQSRAEPVDPPTQPRVICNDCGTISNMRAIEQEGEASGAGAVLGAIAGGLIGNQIGGGHGKEAATAAGAIAGGFGGHMAEKKIREGTSYKVSVKMDSGYTRSVTLTSEQAVNYSVGSKVRVDDDGNLSQH